MRAGLLPGQGIVPRVTAATRISHLEVGLPWHQVRVLVRIRCAPPRIRTGNLLILSQTPLPVGLEGRACFTIPNSLGGPAAIGTGGGPATLFQPEGCPNGVKRLEPSAGIEPGSPHGCGALPLDNEGSACQLALGRLPMLAGSALHIRCVATAMNSGPRLRFRFRS